MGRLPVKGPVVIPNCVEVKLYWTNSGFTFTNVLHGQATGTPPIDNALANSLHTAFANALTTSGWITHLPATTEFLQIGVKDLRSAHMPEFLSNGAASVGTATGNSLGDNTAFCVTQFTNQSGREWRGRTYLGGMAASSTVDGRTPASGVGVDGVAFLNAIMTAMSSNQIPMVVAQRALQAGTDSGGNALPPRSANVVGVTGVRQTGNRLDSQRRRLGR